MIGRNCATPLRAAIIGVGRIAGLFASTEAVVPKTHAQAMRSHGIDIAAIYDTEEARALSFAEKWGGEHRRSIGNLLDDFPGLDIVVITSPDCCHAAQAAEVLAADHPPHLLIIEKPPAVASGEMASLLDAAAACPKTRVVVNMTRRFDPRHAEAASLIASGTLGTMVSAHFTYYGGWLHNGIHAVDVIRYLLSDEIDIVSVQQGAPGHKGDPCLDVEAVRRSEPDARILFSGLDERLFQLFELEIRFREGRIRFEDFGNRILVEAVEVNEIGERELGAPKLLADTDNRTAIDLLYSASCHFLNTGDPGVLEHVALHQVALTMEVIFDAIEQA